MKDRVLNALEVNRVDSNFTFLFEAKNYSASLIESENLSVYTSGMAGFFKPPYDIGLIIKIYWNAECGKLYPGFFSPCIGSFGRHRAFGKMMEWTVNNWESCKSGDSICLEVLQNVCSITYYPGLSCMDTIFTKVDILRFACK